MKTLFAAFKFLTLWGRFTDSQPDPLLVGKSAPYFPLVGLCLGLILALSYRALEKHLDFEILSIVLTSLLILATGALHLKGLHGIFTARANGRAPASGIDTGAAIGVVAIVVALFFKIRSIDILEVKLTVGLLLVPVLARWALVVFIYGSYRYCEGEAGLIAQGVRFWHLLLTSIAALAPAAYWLGRTGLWIGLSLSIFVLLCRALMVKRKGALTRDSFTGIVELNEVLSLTLLASL